MLENLLKEKLLLASFLKSLTKEIIALSSKQNYEKINLMLDERQAIIDKINLIDKDIKTQNQTEDNKIKELKKQLKTIFIETAKLENLLRKNIIEELKQVKKNLNQQQAPSNSLNIKA